MHYKSKHRKRPFLIAAVLIIVVTLLTVILCCCTIAKESVEAKTPSAVTPVTAYLNVREAAFYQPIHIEPAPEPQNTVRLYSEIPFEEEMQELLWSACEETGCPYELALSVIWHESRYQNVNGDGGNSIGYMQVQPKWHQERMERLDVTDLSDPLSNFRVGCDLLAELIEKYDSIEKALTCYNTGSPGTSKYANRVMNYMDETFFVN